MKVEVTVNGWEIKNGVVAPIVMYGKEIAPFGSATLQRVFETELSGSVDMKKCKELVANIRTLHSFEPAHIVVRISDENSASYNVKLNRLQICRNGELVYENWDGVISRDSAALADSRNL